MTASLACPGFCYPFTLFPPKMPVNFAVVRDVVPVNTASAGRAEFFLAESGNARL
jgi:hypothetical protein